LNVAASTKRDVGSRSDRRVAPFERREHRPPEVEGHSQSKLPGPPAFPLATMLEELTVVKTEALRASKASASSTANGMASAEPFAPSIVAESCTRCFGQKKCS
jgi:hypothetical protein